MQATCEMSNDAALNRGSVLFVAFQDQDNLGVGYLASTLIEHGYVPFIVDFRLGKEEILHHIRLKKPLLVGFSIIFQYHIHSFKELLLFLRQEGINCHFSAGGHYPSLRWNNLMTLIPELDSTVLFEGENTLSELVDAIAHQQPWDSIVGLAVRWKGELKANPLRALEDDLDNFPPPLRPPLRELVPGFKFATLLASRGCRYNCVFCSIRQFYSQPPGRVKRIRRPETVVEEMVQLFQRMDCTTFMFQDDDFPVGGSEGRKWVAKFCSRLEHEGLAGKILWKINCRPDEVEEDVLKMMRDHGLFLVYMGIEAGSDTGLKHMNKHSTLDQTFNAVNILKKLDICFDYGFMLFAPWTTPQLIREDLQFLRKICSDGSTSVTFCKMLPYADTKIEKLLFDAGKIKGITGEEDYDFDDVVVTRVHDILNEIFYDWVGTREGLLNASRVLRYELAIPLRMTLANKKSTINTVRREVEQVIAEANNFLLQIAERVLQISENPVGPQIMKQLNKTVREHHDNFMKSLESIDLHLQVLSSSMSADRTNMVEVS